MVKTLYQKTCLHSVRKFQVCKTELYIVHHEHDVKIGEHTILPEASLFDRGIIIMLDDKTYRETPSINTLCTQSKACRSLDIEIIKILL